MVSPLPLTHNLRSDAPLPHDAEKLAERKANELIDFSRKLRERRAREHNWGSVDFHRRARLSGTCFLISDLIALPCAYIAGLGVAAIPHLQNGSFANFLADMRLPQLVASLGLALMAIVWLYSKGHYRQRLPQWEILGHFAKISIFGFMASGFIQYAMKDSYSRLHLGFFWVFFGLFLVLGRSLTRRALAALGQWTIRTLVIGNKKSAAAIATALEHESGLGFDVVEQLSPDTLHDFNDDIAWKQLLVLHGADHLFLALEGGEIDNHSTALKAMARSRVPSSIVPPWLGLPASNLTPHHFLMRDVFFLHDTNFLRMPLLRFMKRAFDIALSGAALIILLPVMTAVALTVRRDGGPAFFSQPRLGRSGKVFACYKFRSMRVDAEDFLQHYLATNPNAAEEWAKYQKLQNDVRITPFGQFIRRTSLDELPQLINVLKGDMSLVGPRPMMPEQAGFYGENLLFYESVRPGITGPWQVSGRSKLTFEERVGLEAWYARNWNLWTDIAIILKTFPVLLKRGHAV